MRIVEVTAVTPEIVESIGRLIPQLSTSAPIPTADQLENLVASDAAQLLIARDPDREDRIVGTLTLVLYRIPTGVRAWIEDVVVDESARRRGVGELLCRAAIHRARSAGARNVDLTSRSARKAANRLYRRLGFSLRETNLYRFSLEQSE
ncbi:MAG: GNAT family N-acetyltransferase [Candidatus Aminicenantes bacterium]|nr:GNAT family N-acetyltransferase [Candidatus Aminicenantes bacterium]